MDSSLQHLFAGRKPESVERERLALYNHTNLSMSSETEYRARALADRLGETFHILANEPSLALYRIEEHVRKSVPRIVERQKQISSLTKDVQGHCSDVDIAIDTLSSLGRSRQYLENIHEMAKNALFLKQQLDYEKKRKVVTNSMTEALKRGSSDMVSLFSTRESSTERPAAGTSVVEAARTFLRSKTLDYSQNLMRRSEVTKSVEVPSSLVLEPSGTAGDSRILRASSVDNLCTVSEEHQSSDATTSPQSPEDLPRDSEQKSDAKSNTSDS